MRLAYNTNGFPQHRLEDVVAVLAELGYDGVAITPDVFHLDPYGDGLARARELRLLLADAGLDVAVETGARFLLDPRRKHQPTLLSGPAGAARRLELLQRCLEIAAVLEAETFSFWSGAPDEPWLSRDEALERLCVGAEALLDAAPPGGPTICLEPEPGMLVASLTDFEGFTALLGRDELRLMLDVGHVPVTETFDPAEAVRRQAGRLAGLQLDDSRDGVHEHLLPGEGTIDWPGLLAAVKTVGFQGLASLELPRHGHDPVTTARRARTFLERAAPRRSG